MAVDFVCEIFSLFVTVNCVKGILLLGSSHLSVRLIVVIVFASSFARTRSANCDSDCDARSAYQLAASSEHDHQPSPSRSQGEPKSRAQLLLRQGTLHSQSLPQAGRASVAVNAGVAVAVDSIVAVIVVLASSF